MLKKGRQRMSWEENKEIESNIICVYKQFGFCLIFVRNKCMCPYIVFFCLCSEKFHF